MHIMPAWQAVLANLACAVTGAGLAQPVELTHPARLNRLCRARNWRGLLSQRDPRYGTGFAGRARFLSALAKML